VITTIRPDICVCYPGIFLKNPPLATQFCPAIGAWLERGVYAVSGPKDSWCRQHFEALYPTNRNHGPVAIPSLPLDGILEA